jgi:energy-coupling factor transporter ATP-binding protein EcfA2
VPPPLLERDLVVVTGKGGVGKTTVAAALGLLGHRRGRRTVVVEVARRDDVTRVLPRGGPDHLSIDPETAMELYLADQLGSRAGVELLTRSKAFTYLVAAAPGLRELLTMGHVWDLSQPERRTGGDPYDLVVLDAPASGHAVALLQAAGTIGAAVPGRIARQARTIDAMLADPDRTGVVAVARAEELPVAEALELEDRLPVELVACNAVRPRPLRHADREALAPRAAEPPVAAALAQDDRARAQHAQLARLRRAARAPIVTLRHRVEPDLPALAAELERAL